MVTFKVQFPSRSRPVNPTAPLVEQPLLLPETPFISKVLQLVTLADVDELELSQASVEKAKMSGTTGDQQDPTKMLLTTLRRKERPMGLGSSQQMTEGSTILLRFPD
jgi:hypothetical protein